jgi:7,8-dihydropterin-6-yl-methyl-4-(beta-D-ribofuranosyl)aminobenzene 5'-phosphate synthase
VLSHHHADHTGGLLTLREALGKQNPAALSRAHVAEGFFLDRTSPDGRAQGNSMVALRAAYEAAGGKLVVHTSASEILPGVWVSGPVPRPHPERNWPRAGRIRTPQGMVEDSIPEDMSLYIDTPRGLVVITGCGHAGTVDTVQHAMSVVHEAPAYGLIGGCISSPPASSGSLTCSAPTAPGSRLSIGCGSSPASTERPRSPAPWAPASASTAG